MNNEKEIERRAKIIEGHLKKVIKMIAEKEYCIDILNQSAAVQAALRKLDEKILEDHLSTCVIRQIKEGKAESASREVLEVFKRRSS